MPADRVTRFAVDLLDSAAVEGARHSRSAKQQLDHWARVGRTVSAYHSTARRRVEAALDGTLPLTALSPRGAPGRQRGDRCRHRGAAAQRALRRRPRGRGSGHRGARRRRPPSCSTTPMGRRPAWIDRTALTCASTSWSGPTARASRPSSGSRWRPAAPASPSSTPTSSPRGAGPTTPRRTPTGRPASRAMCTTLIERRQPLIAETVFSHPVEARRAARRDRRGLLHRGARAHGPRGARRGPRRARVAAGGHTVPEDKIRGRYRRLWPLVAEAIGLADTATAYDNTKRDGPRPVAVWSHGFAVGSPTWPDWAPAALTLRWTGPG